MEKHKKCEVLSKIKPGEINLNKGDNDLKVESYFCSKLMTSVNILLQGEDQNLQFETRNALITAICINTGILIGKN